MPHEKSPAILQVLPELNTGGVERGTVDIAAAIANVGWRSYVASAGGKLQSKLAYAKAEHLTLPLATKNLFSLWSNAGSLSDLIEQKNISLIHARSRAPAWSAYWAAKRTGIPFLTTFHGFYGTGSSLKRKYNSVMTRGERVIAVSHAVAAHLVEVYGVEQERIRVIHRGVDLKLFAPDKIIPQRMVDLSKQWNLADDGKPLILLPGRLTRWKGQEVAIRAVAELPHRDFQLILLGSGDKHPEYVSDLKNLIADLKLEDVVKLVGDTQYMPEAYMLASLVLAPSLNPEAFGRVATEAQAMGKPIIATAHGGAMETVMPGDTGWLVAPDNVKELSTAILRALSLPEDEKHRMHDNAIWNVHTHFSLDVMQQQTIAVYEEILGITSAQTLEQAA